MYTLAAGIVFLTAGLIAGYLSPEKSWRWGLWICGPLLLLLLLSLAFSGNGSAFLQKDVPLLLVSIPAACLGGFAGSRIKRNRHQQ